MVVETAPRGRFRDRSTHLLLFGTVSLGIGGFLIMLALLHLLPIFFGDVEAFAALAGDPRALAPGLIVYGLLGAAFVWGGIGSIRKRRWVPSVMRVLAWTWLIGGVLALVLVGNVVRGMLAVSASGADELPPAVVFLIQALVFALVAGFGVVLPAAFVWVYRDADLLRTCQAHDVRPSWTERCPPSVLGLSLGLALAALLTVPLVLRPVVPLFGLLITGWPGAVMMLLLALACAWTGFATYRLSKAGFFGALALLTLGGLSVLVTFVRVEPIEYYRALGYSEAQLELLHRSGVLGKARSLWLAGGLTVATVAYMAAIYRHFASHRS